MPFSCSHAACQACQRGNDSTLRGSCTHLIAHVLAWLVGIGAGGKRTALGEAAGEEERRGEDRAQSAAPLLRGFKSGETDAPPASCCSRCNMGGWH